MGESDRAGEVICTTRPGDGGSTGGGNSGKGAVGGTGHDSGGIGFGVHRKCDRLVAS